MSSNKIALEFKEIKETFGLSKDEIRYLDNQTSKLAKSPEKAIHYLEKIRNFFNTKQEIVDKLAKITDDIQEKAKNTETAKKFISIFEKVREADIKTLNVFVRAFSMFLSNLISPEIFKDFALIILQKIKQNNKATKDSLNEIINTVTENSIGFLLSLLNSGNSKISFLYNPSCDVSTAFQYVMFASFILDAEEFQHFINSIWLYSFSLLSRDSTNNIITAIDKNLAQYFMQISQKIQKIEFHPSKLSKYYPNFVYPAASNYLTEGFISYVTSSYYENQVENCFQLANLSRFYVTRFTDFYDNYSYLDSRATRMYHFYLDTARFLRTQEEDDFSGLAKAAEYIFGHRIPLDVIDREGFLTKLLEYYLNETRTYSNRTIDILKERLKELETDLINYRDIFKKLYGVPLIRRKLITEGFEFDLPTRKQLNQILEPLNPLIEMLEISEKIEKMNNFVFSKKCNHLLDEYTAISVIYYFILIEIMKTITDDEKNLDLKQIFTGTNPPYTDLHAEMSCVDMILMKLASSLEKAIDEGQDSLSIDYQGEIYNEGDFLYNIKTEDDKVTILPVINAFVFPHD
ncbi:hypothetical protein TVAG_458830 [Trichomonas vaginalis G3]|uniref:Uncharacterized protein n=1 Tax=Trichomonas vaginalis (strain ATCC PRA-98 / G3) TaxID=412133 RepID=A2E688_TRIV3|nr:hypothetical protein TVAGG3_0394290 [Trichomonas vaginalis G3]EAY11811.1 hypothetical protein TVAG_458830 [Trichomonas vaginalis G3]KAI5534217.1 hypothetical protein TVAGG3_0394290 [Trichomonas vaginalis G3]|eukprot:XP_001324034.1 hypothetical protein [Trichomonas vaginalis G3]